MSHDDSHDDHTPIGTLPRDLEPPSHLEDRVVHRLQQARLIRKRSNGWSKWHLVAASLVFAAGLFAGRYTRAPLTAPAEPTQPKFLLLLYPGESLQTDPRGGDALAREYGAWAAGLRRSGRAISGERLAADPAVGVGAASPAAGATTLQGFFIITANSIQEASTLAEASPHVRRGGRIVVRAIDTPR